MNDEGYVVESWEVSLSVSGWIANDDDRKSAATEAAALFPEREL